MSQNPEPDLGQVLGLILGQEKCLLNCTPDLRRLRHAGGGLAARVAQGQLGRGHRRPLRRERRQRHQGTMMGLFGLILNFDSILLVPRIHAIMFILQWNTASMSITTCKGSSVICGPVFME